MISFIKLNSYLKLEISSFPKIKHKGKQDKKADEVLVK